jgi:hypothetical protein
MFHGSPSDIYLLLIKSGSSYLKASSEGEIKEKYVFHDKVNQLTLTNHWFLKKLSNSKEHQF